jgi:UDP-N-acetylglucosamine--N-acetylmuramyl-(pentapeptide) pyrophosphoryl-undecaprenol N-acetylglucosamine transferase
MTTRVVLAGGGTSGHVLPALAIAESLIELGVAPVDILFVGTTRGVETKLVPEAGFRLEAFDVTGLQRSLSASSLRRNLGFLPRLVRARRRARRLLDEFGADVVVSVGGYASLPAVLAARSSKTPVVVVSYDRRPGRSSQLTARWAAATATAFPDSSLPRAHHTGAPVRRSIRNIGRRVDREAARSRLGIPPNAFFVAVVGGSLGSASLNHATSAVVREFLGDPNLHIRHVVGERFVPDVEAAMKPLLESAERRIGYDLVGYESDMAAIYSGADLLVGRGGAGTVAEVATVGIPAVLVPWSGAADDHQTENVRWLSEKEAAVLMSDEAVVAELANTIADLRREPNRLVDLGQHAYALGELNRTGGVARLVLDVARGDQTAP